MHFSKSLLSAAALALLATFSLSAHADSIVSDGNFSGGITPSWTVSGSGTTPGIGITQIALGGPASSTPYSDVIPTSPNGSTTAAYLVDDYANETFSQTVMLAANTSYVLSFELYGVPSGAGNTYDYSLMSSIGGVSSAFDSSSVTVGSWTLQTLAFTSGAAGAYNLNFDFNSGATPAKDLALTDIAINPPAVPEPSAIALFGTGVLGMAGMIRRRFRS